MESSSPSPQPDPPSLCRAQRFALRELGEASAARLGRQETSHAVQQRVELGFTLQDAVLAEIHRAAKQDRELADEFVAFFLQDMLRVGSRALSSGLRRYLDTGDLVQSVLGDLWAELAELKFESRARFVSLLGRRLSWKAADRARGLAAGRRREDRRVHPTDGAPEPTSEQPGPETRAQLSESDERLALVLPRLPRRDRRLLRARLAGASTAEIAEREGLNQESARKALARARQRAQEILGEPS